MQIIEPTRDEINFHSSENQRILSRFVEREVIHCASSMISELADSEEFRGDLECLYSRDDWETPLDEETVSIESLEYGDECRALKTADDVHRITLKRPQGDIFVTSYDVDIAKDEFRELLVRLEIFPTLCDDVESIIEDLEDDQLAQLPASGVSAFLETVKITEFDGKQLPLDTLESIGGVETDNKDPQEICEELGLDPQSKEPLEFWIVSDYLARKLEEKGEIVGELFDFHIWGRCGSGQAILLDSVICEIAYGMEILHGQAYAWE